MCHPSSKILAVSAGFFVVSIFNVAARPIDYSEVSLLVRSGESDSAIIREVSERKLVRPLTSQQEGTLKSQGAPDSLIRNLRNSNLILSQADAAAYLSQQQEAGKNRSAERGRSHEQTRDESPSEQVQIFELSYGHPINLSKWGGPPYEVAFHTRRFAGEDIIEPVLNDTSRTFVDTATYLGAGRPDDSTTIFDRRNYVSVISYSDSRCCRIDMNNPVSIKGVPYLLYPVYGAGGVSLYYIGKSADSVKVAVGTWN